MRATASSTASRGGSSQTVTARPSRNTRYPPCGPTTAITAAAARGAGRPGRWVPAAARRAAQQRVFTPARGLGTGRTAHGNGKSWRGAARRGAIVGAMGALSGHADFRAAGADLHQGGPQRQQGSWPGWLGWLEALAVAVAPLAAALVLRLRLMAPSVVPDPAMHTIYIVDPHDVFTRYGAIYAASGRLREGARPGFLVPARLAYLAFGAVPGFLVTRYVFALVAVVPIYLLLRRCYGPPAGVVGILAVLSSPVIVTAWGTDYPDSAVVSYAAGALACLAMPCAPGRRRWWLAAAGALFTLAVWAHGVAVPLVAATLAGYLGVRLLRERARLPGDLAVLAAAAAVVTGLLVVASAVVIGDANFIGITLQADRALSHQTATWHAATWRWAPYVTYLLVPPAVLAAFAVAVTRRGRPLPVPLLVVGVVTAGQIVVYALLQFAGSLQILELHYFSSTLWAAVCLALAVTVAELSRPLSGHPLARWVPPAVLLAVPLAYEAYPHVLAFGWGPFGIVLAAGAVGAAAAARGCGALWRPVAAATATGLALAVFAAAILVLTIAAAPQHRPVPGTSHDPPPAYAT